MKVLLTIIILAIIILPSNAAPPITQESSTVNVVTVKAPWVLNTELEIDRVQGDCRNPSTVGGICPQEIRPPAYWTAWWVDDDRHGQPEMLLTDLPERVKSGRYAFKSFTFWRRQNLGLFQPFDVPEPGQYRATVYYHSWYSNCSSAPFSPPLDYDCTTILVNSHLRARVGLSPLKESNPFSHAILWGPWEEQYGTPWLKLESPWTFTRGSLTFWIQAESNDPLKHEDTYWDKFRLEYMD